MSSNSLKDLKERLSGSNSITAMLDLKKKAEGINSESPKEKSLRVLKVADVVSREQVRKTFEGLEELAQSLKELGQQTPILVEPKNGEGKYVILQGERRWRAAKIAGLDKIEAIVVSEQKAIADEQRIFGQLAENLQRDDMKPLEVARALRPLVDKLGAVEVGKRLGFSHSWVSQRAQLTDMPEWLTAIAEKMKDVMTIVTLRKIAFTRPDIAQDLILKNLDEDGVMSRRDAKDLLKRIEQPKAPELKTAPAAKANESKAKVEHEAKHGKTSKAVAEKAEDDPGYDVDDPSVDPEDDWDDPEDVEVHDVDAPSQEREDAHEPARQTGTSKPVLPVKADQAKLPAGCAVDAAARVWVGVNLDVSGMMKIVDGYLTPHVSASDESKICVTLASGEIVLVNAEDAFIKRVGA